ncbi:MAG: HD domain-containing protein [Caldilineaceae bacterium]|nr:HD domain-containing protein [Caldilineaceae bacterium]
MISQPHAQLNLLTLPTAQRQVLLYLVREGPTSEAALARALNQEPDGLAATVAALQMRHAITIDATGRLCAELGRTRRRALPARLWPALQTASRLYSAQEIATLRTVVPILQFARARMGEFTDHGPGHVLRVKVFATQLGHVLGLTANEQHLLRAAALLHDVGNVVDRATHHVISQETVEKLAATDRLPFSRREAELVGLLCRWHRREYDPERCDELAGETVRTGLMASILRVADALDSDYRRVDYDDKFKRVLALFYPEEVPFLADLDTILGIRICCTPKLQLQIFVQPGTQAEQSFHIRALRKDVAETPLDCTIQVIECAPAPLSSRLARDVHARQAPLPAAQTDRPHAIIACPLDPHSVIMAALSRKHLFAAGHRVELLIFPDAADATSWLWRTELADREPSECAHLILIGDRPDADATSTLLAQVERWQNAGAQVTILNRHEANWGRLPHLLRQTAHAGNQVILGGDWAYFWGDQIDEADIFWGRIAALCTRDPVQSTVGLSSDEQTVSQGLLNAIYDHIASVRRAPTENVNWTTLITPLLERIATDDRGWFIDQASTFGPRYAVLPAAGQPTGKAMWFELTAPTAPHAVYWGLEAAIEARGRMPVRGICYRTPYAIATWSDSSAEDETNGGAVELLAINHWREEEATPIRLLYPPDIGPAPEGNECAIRVRLPTALAQQVVQLLIAACNEN